MLWWKISGQNKVNNEDRFYYRGYFGVIYFVFLYSFPLVNLFPLSTCHRVLTEEQTQPSSCVFFLVTLWSGAKIRPPWHQSLFPCPIGSKTRKFTGFRVLPKSTQVNNTFQGHTNMHLFIFLYMHFVSGCP